MFLQWDQRQKCSDFSSAYLTVTPFPPSVLNLNYVTWSGIMPYSEPAYGMAEVNLEKFANRFSWEVKPQPAAADGEGKSSVDFSSLDCVAHV